MTAAARAEAERILARFAEAGAEVVETPILLPAARLLDLYGEDIRARAYVTSDPLQGEMMLRPDFTVPLVEAHLGHGAANARYAYAGKVFRRQEAAEPHRPSEYLQVGYEVFGGSAAASDAEAFATIVAALEGLPLRAVTGDIGILVAAVKGLNTIAPRKAALLRHIWRPRRFRRLLDRFSGKVPLPDARLALLAEEHPLAAAGPEMGLRTRQEIAGRIATLRTDAAAPPISAEEVELLDHLVSLRAPAPEALGILEGLSVDLPAIAGATERMEARLQALDGRGIDLEAMDFEASFGRTSLEYYDGFVFGLTAPGRPDLAPLATGGRYDALTRVLGGGTGFAAVGGVIRPELVVELRGVAP